jgi:hypothetical protein
MKVIRYVYCLVLAACRRRLFFMGNAGLTNPRMFWSFRARHFLTSQSTTGSSTSYQYLRPLPTNARVPIEKFQKVGRDRWRSTLSLFNENQPRNAALVAVTLETQQVPHACVYGYERMPSEEAVVSRIAA